MTEKPLFIPLKTEYYRQFEAGTKTCEYRPYGPRWNERTCPVGRLVVLSRGYSTPDRMERVVTGFRRYESRHSPVEIWLALLKLYGSDILGEMDIAEIELGPR